MTAISSGVAVQLPCIQSKEQALIELPSTRMLEVVQYGELRIQRMTFDSCNEHQA